MKKRNLFYLPVIASLVIVILLAFAGCKGEPETVTVTSTITTQAPVITVTSTVTQTTTVTTMMVTTSPLPTTSTESPTTSIGAPQLSAENHAIQTDDSLCAICHGAGAPYEYPADHEGRTSGCLAGGCHTLPE